MYGISSPNPRRINSIAIRTIIIGITLLILCLIEAVVQLPTTEVTNISGTVPNPKAIIYRMA